MGIVNVLSRVIRLFWRYWPRVILAYFCLLLSSGLTLTIPRLTGDAIDLALTQGQLNTLILITLSIVVIGLVRAVATYGQSYLAEFLSQKVAYDLRNRLYDRLQRLSYAFHDHAHTGQLMSRATVDVEGIRMFIGFAMLRGLYFIFLLIALSCLLFVINWQLALLGLSVLPLITYRTTVVSRRLRSLWMKIQQRIGLLGSIVQENLVGARTVRAFAREKFESEKFRHQAEILHDQELEANKHLAFNSPMLNFLLLIAMGGILWYGGRLVIVGTITPGELAQFLIYLTMLSMPVRMLGWLVMSYSRAISSSQRIFDILDQTSPVQEKSQAIELYDVVGEVHFEGVSFSYDSQGPVLEDINFEAKPGQIIALVGSSGSGKSTIANLIPRFYDTTTGQITIDGQDIKDISLSSLRQQIGIIHQDTFLFSATIRENIRYGKPEATSEDIIQAAKIAQLHNFIMGLPEGYDTWVGERGVTLSGGQRQRLAIARTILLNPRILIIDDSTSSIDAATKHLIQRALTNLLKGRTTFIIAQTLTTVLKADSILVLNKGRIVDQGTHHDLLKREGIYQELYNLQFQDQEAEAEPLTAPYTSEAEDKLPEVDNQPDYEAAVNTLQGTTRNRLKQSEDTIYGKSYDSRVISRLIKYLTTFRFDVALATGATVMHTLTTVAVPYLVAVAMDQYVVSANMGGLNLIFFLFIGTALFNWGSYYLQLRTQARAGQGAILKLRNEMFDHLQRLSVSFFDRNRVGRIMSRVQNDVQQLREFLSSNALGVAGELFSLVAIIITLMVLDINLTLITFAVVPLLFLFVAFWQKKARHFFVEIRRAIAAVNATFQESISGVRVVQSLTREEVNSEHFDQVNRAHFEANLRAIRLTATMTPVVELLMALAIALVVLFGGIRVLEGVLLVGALVAFVLYIQRFFTPIRMLTFQYTQLQRAMASGSRIFELLDIKPEIVDAPNSIRLPRLKGEIRFEGVSFGYQPGLEVLHDINLVIQPGQTVALVGPTGAGKSTMVNLIARFYNVTQGQILVDGYHLATVNRASLLPQLGLVLQEPFLFSGTILENIRYGRLEATKKEIINVTQELGIHDLIMQLEKGYHTELQERGQNLSMGQRQLISFSRALLANPSIILLDEATANIDSRSENLLRQALTRLSKSRTTVIIAHRLSTVRNSDRIIVLYEGRITEEGNHQELLSQGGLYTRMYKMNLATVPILD